jgi:hypothetical protein
MKGRGRSSLKCSSLKLSGKALLNLFDRAIFLRGRLSSPSPLCRAIHIASHRSWLYCLPESRHKSRNAALMRQDPALEVGGVKLPERPELLQRKATRNNGLKPCNPSLPAGDAQAAIQAHARLSAAAPPLDPKVYATRERAFLPAEAPLSGVPPSLKPPICPRPAPAGEPELAGHASVRKQGRARHADY